jgi:hypothetical protein
MEKAMVRFAAYGIVALGLLHLVVLGADVPGELPRWASLNLWTFDHWQPVRSQEIDLALSNGIFWSTIGSFAVPTIFLGLLLIYAERRGWPIPPFVGWGLFAWTSLASLVMAPSGFPVAMAVTLLLGIGLQRKARG